MDAKASRFGGFGCIGQAMIEHGKLGVMEEELDAEARTAGALELAREGGACA